MTTSNERPYKQEVITQTVTRFTVESLVEIALAYHGEQLEPHRHYRLTVDGKEVTLPKNAELTVFTEVRERLT